MRQSYTALPELFLVDRPKYLRPMNFQIANLSFGKLFCASQLLRVRSHSMLDLFLQILECKGIIIAQAMYTCK